MSSKYCQALASTHWASSAYRRLHGRKCRLYPVLFLTSVLAGCDGNADSAADQAHLAANAPPSRCQQAPGRNNCVSLGLIRGGTTKNFKKWHDLGITSDEFKTLLKAEFDDRGLSANDPSVATYRLEADIVSLAQPMNLYDQSVTADVKYTVYAGTNTTPAFQIEIKNTDTEKSGARNNAGPVLGFLLLSYASIQDLRQTAYVNAVVANIEEMITKFGQATGIPVAPSPIPEGYRPDSQTAN